MLKSQWRIASPPKAHTQTVMLKRPFRKHLWVQSFADAFDLNFFGGILIWTKQSEIFYPNLSQLGQKERTHIPVKKCIANL